MPFLSRRDIPAALRRPHEKEYRVTLRQILNDPLASDERKEEAHKQIERLKPASGRKEER